MSSQLTINSLDQVTYKVPRIAAALSGMLDSMLMCVDEFGEHKDMQSIDIPTIYVSSSTLAPVIQFCIFYSNSPLPIEANLFNKEFMNVDIFNVVSLLHAACYMDIPKLQELCEYHLALFLQTAAPFEIRECLKIHSDLHPDIENAILDEKEYIAATYQRRTL